MLLTTVRTTRRNATRRAAFTLLEVLVVVAILVILAGVASISIFRYMEDAKVGRAQADMKTLETAINTFHTRHQEWPQSLEQVAPYLDQQQAGLYDPWNQPYTFEIREFPGSDGQSVQRPVIYCQPPGNKPMITVPNLNTGR